MKKSVNEMPCGRMEAGTWTRVTLRPVYIRCAVGCGIVAITSVRTHGPGQGPLGTRTLEAGLGQDVQEAGAEAEEGQTSARIGVDQAGGGNQGLVPEEDQGVEANQDLHYIGNEENPFLDPETGQGVQIENHGDYLQVTNFGQVYQGGS